MAIFLTIPEKKSIKWNSKKKDFIAETKKIDWLGSVWFYGTVGYLMPNPVFYK